MIQNTRDIKANFPYSADKMCPMGCMELDTPAYCIKCKYIPGKENDVVDMRYNDVFSEIVDKQGANCIPPGEEGGCQFLYNWSWLQSARGHQRQSHIFVMIIRK